MAIDSTLNRLMTRRWQKTEHWRLTFALIDGVAATIALALTVEAPPFIYYSAIPFWVFIATSFFDPRWAVRYLRSISTALFTGIIFAIFFIITSNIHHYHFIIVTSALSLTTRCVCIALLTSKPFRRRILIVTDGEVETIYKIKSGLQTKANIVAGVLSINADGGIPVEKTLSLNITTLILDLQNEITPSTLSALIEFHRQGIEVISLAIFYEQITGRLLISHLHAESFFVSDNNLTRFYERSLDLACSMIGLAFMVIILPFVSAAIWLDSGLPIFYYQTRMGDGGRIFKLIKFRTMIQDAEQDGQVHWADLNDPRVTRVGRILRRTRLDEVPQFWNVFVGEMSLIGPRPERPEFISVLESHIPLYRARLLVKPGLTGWAQINFPYTSTIEDAFIKLQYDLYYVKYRTFLLDLLIIWHTLKTIIQLTGT